jgi:hypothetical protein
MSKLGTFIIGGIVGAIGIVVVKEMMENKHFADNVKKGIDGLAAKFKAAVETCSNR